MKYQSTKFIILVFVFLFIGANVILAAKKSSTGRGSKKDKRNAEASTANSNPSKVEKDKKNAEQRLKDLSTMMRSTNLIPLSDRNFSKFIVDRPRYYHAAVMFTATAPQYQCSICGMARDSFLDAASFSREQYMSSGNFLTVNPSERILFFILEVDDARNTFSDMELETVPRTYLLPPRDIGDAKVTVQDYEVESRSLMEGVGSFLEAVEKKTSIKVSSIFSLR